MPKLIDDTVIYKFSTEEIKKMLAADLSVPIEAISVKYDNVDVSDQYINDYPRYETESVSVTVDRTKIK
jgi:hypothetical protein